MLMAPMAAVVELTDKPCPECGQLLEIRVQLRKGAVAESKQTVKLDRVLYCPECGYSRDASLPE
jgi:hypothetical protein